MNYTTIVIESISKLIKKPILDISTASKLQEDLQLDSLDVVELLMDIEDASLQDLDPNTFENCKTVGDLVKILENLNA
jgi:acyl carrier protein